MAALLQTLITWEDHYEALLKYKSKYGTMNVSPTHCSESKLCRELAMWVTFQRANLHKLNEEQRRLWGELLRTDGPLEAAALLREQQKKKKQQQQQQQTKKKEPSMQERISNALYSRSSGSSSSSKQQQQRKQSSAVAKQDKVRRLAMDWDDDDRKTDSAPARQREPEAQGTQQQRSSSLAPLAPKPEGDDFLAHLEENLDTMMVAAEEKQQQQQTPQDSRPRPASYKGSRQPVAKKHLAPKCSNHHKQWFLMFKKLVKYKETYGDCNVPVRYADDPPFGKWVSRQREMHSNKKLPATRVLKLQNLGFQWRVGKPNPNLGGQAKYEENWMARFKQLVSYKRKHGDFRVPVDYHDRQFRGWVHKQRSIEIQKSMRPDRKELLTKIGFWDDVLHYPMKNPYAKKRQERESQAKQAIRLKAAQQRAHFNPSMPKAAADPSLAQQQRAPLKATAAAAADPQSKHAALEAARLKAAQHQQQQRARFNSTKSPGNSPSPSMVAKPVKTVQEVIDVDHDAQGYRGPNEITAEAVEYQAKARALMELDMKARREEQMRSMQRLAAAPVAAPPPQAFSAVQNQVRQIQLENQVRQLSLQNQINKQVLLNHQSQQQMPFESQKQVLLNHQSQQQMPFESTAAYLQRSFGGGSTQKSARMSSIQEQLEINSQLQASLQNKMRQLQNQPKQQQQLAQQLNNNNNNNNNNLVHVHNQARRLPTQNRPAPVEQPAARQSPSHTKVSFDDRHRPLTTVTPPLTDDEEPVAKRPKAATSKRCRNKDARPSNSSYRLEESKPTPIEIVFPSVDADLKAVHDRLKELAAAATKNGTLPKPRSKRKACRFVVGSTMAPPTLADIERPRMPAKELLPSGARAPPRRMPVVIPPAEPVASPPSTTTTSPEPSEEKEATTPTTALPTTTDGKPKANLPNSITPDRPLLPLLSDDLAANKDSTIIKAPTVALNLVVTHPSKTRKEVTSFEDAYLLAMKNAPPPMTDWKRKRGWSYVMALD